jgi:hypothetical protein
MTEEQLERVLRTWQRRLRLDHWDLAIPWGLRPGQNPDGTGEIDDSNAEIRIHEDYDQASIRLSSEYPTWSAEMANRTLVHELLHIFERGSDEAVKALAPDVTGALSKLAYELFWNRYNHESENWVDRLAIIFVDLVGVVE